MEVGVSVEPNKCIARASAMRGLRMKTPACPSNSVLNVDKSTESDANQFPRMIAEESRHRILSSGWKTHPKDEYLDDKSQSAFAASTLTSSRSLEFPARLAKREKSSSSTNTKRSCFVDAERALLAA